MKKNKKKQKGFSLVELIVVIAVMAVLVVVLAPAYLRYVEKSKLQKDISAIGEVIEAIKISAADEEVADEIMVPNTVTEQLEEWGALAYAQVVIENGTGTVTATKLDSNIGIGDLFDQVSGGLIDGIFKGDWSTLMHVPREEAPILKKEVTATVGNTIEFETEDLKKLDLILTVVKDTNYKINVTVNAHSYENYPKIYAALQKLGESAESYDASCKHTREDFTNSVCNKCNYKCETHNYDSSNGQCKVCDAACTEHSWNSSNGKCDICGMACTHNWNTETGVCEVCGLVCGHRWSGNTCSTCGKVCEHVYTYTSDNGYTHSVGCENCNYSASEGHSISEETGKCTSCDFVCPHTNKTYTEVTITSELTGHSVTCTDCYYIINAAQHHTIEDGACKYCTYVEGGECVTPDTLITLADGSQKRVDELDGSEELLVWSLETGSYDSAKIMFVDSDAMSNYEVITLYFEDGTSVDVIGEHGFWDFDLNRYVYLDENASEYIGHSFFKASGESWVATRLVDVKINIEETTAWSPVTAGHLCYFVNGMLSMPGGVGGLFNIFEVDSETMMYDYDQMNQDIETYGLFTYEELASYGELSEEMFNEAGGAYLKVSMGKENLTMEELQRMIERYGKFFE